MREAAGELEPQLRAAPPRTSVVAVASGPGVRQIFLSLGVDRLVAGGQSMNPSTADILDMAESAPGSEVVLLPNNKNIIPVANQVVELSTKKVVVVPTLGIQEGFAALLAYDPAEGAAENAEAMGEMAAGVVAGEVTQAIRDATGPTGADSRGRLARAQPKRHRGRRDDVSRCRHGAHREAARRRARDRHLDRGLGRRAGGDR